MTYPGSIKGSQKKGNKKICIGILIYKIGKIGKTGTRENLTGKIKLAEIVHQELDTNPDPFFPMRIHNTDSLD